MPKILEFQKNWWSGVGNRKREGKRFKCYLEGAPWFLKCDHVYLVEEEEGKRPCSNFITCLQQALHFIKLSRDVLAGPPIHNSETWILVLLFCYF